MFKRMLSYNMEHQVVLLPSDVFPLINITFGLVTDLLFYADFVLSSCTTIKLV